MLGFYSISSAAISSPGPNEFIGQAAITGTATVTADAINARTAFFGSAAINVTATVTAVGAIVGEEWSDVAPQSNTWTII